MFKKDRQPLFILEVGFHLLAKEIKSVKLVGIVNLTETPKYISPTESLSHHDLRLLGLPTAEEVHDLIPNQIDLEKPLGPYSVGGLQWTQHLTAVFELWGKNRSDQIYRKRRT